MKEAITQKINGLKELKDKDDAAAIQNATGELSAELQKIGESLYNKKDESQPGNN